MTLLIHVAEKQIPTNPLNPNVHWRPWVGCAPGDETIIPMAAHRHLRDRGGLGSDEDEPLILYVLYRQEGDPQANWKKFSITSDHTWVRNAHLFHQP